MSITVSFWVNVLIHRRGVNLQTANQMALHTQTGCTVPDGVTQTGHTGVKNCDNASSTGAGCTVIDANTNSYGQPFADAGGGVWVTEFAATGINIWFFSVSITGLMQPAFLI